jgi:hypothetical protein
MTQSPPPPLDPKIAELLRTTEFGAPPAGTKGRVRNQLALAGVVSALRDGGIGTTATPTGPAISSRSQESVWRTAADTSSWAAKVSGKSALMWMAGIAMGAAAALLSVNPGAPPRPVERSLELPRIMPSAVPEMPPHAELDPAAPPSQLTLPHAAPSGIKKSIAAETLGFEQKVLARARAALGRNDPASAMQEIDRHARLFPNGNLNEEREALRIVALAQQGNMTAARERAARFRRAYPRSIQLSTVDGAVTERP